MEPGEMGESQDKEPSNPLVSVVLPVLNEEEGLAYCIELIRKVFVEANINGEIVVSDNGSTDTSIEIAKSLAVNLVHQPLRGYGNAYLKGFSAATGKYLIMADADATYDFNLIPDFIRKLDEGYDFVTGSRYAAGGDEHITFLHRYVGNPILTFILNTLFQTKYTDVYCGYRAFTRESYDKIAPVSPGMEFNLELAINAHLAGLKIYEIPIKLAPRKGESKLETFSDGWRSLRMILVYSPNYVFMYPGFSLFLTGFIMHILVIMRVIHYEGRSPGSVTGIVATMLSVLGFQILSLGLHAKTYSWSRRFDKDNASLLKFYKNFDLERGMLLGLFCLLSGFFIVAILLSEWLRSNLMPLSNPEWMPFAATLIIIGCGTIFTSLFISAMSMTKTKD